MKPITNTTATTETSDLQQLGARVRKWAVVIFPVPLGAGAGELCPKRDLRSRTSSDPTYSAESFAEYLTSCY